MTTTARDLMTAEVLTIRSHQPIADVAKIFAEKKISGCPVLDAEGQVVGVISTTDLVRDSQEGIEGAFFRFALGFGEDLLEGEAWGGPAGQDPDELLLKHEDTDTVAALMTRKVFSVEVGATVAEVAKEMMERRVHRLVVTDEGTFVGLISATDLLRHLAARE